MGCSCRSRVLFSRSSGRLTCAVSRTSFVGGLPRERGAPAAGVSRRPATPAQSRQPDCRLAAPPFLGLTGFAPGLGASALPSMTGLAPLASVSGFVLPNMPLLAGLDAPVLG